MLVLRLAGIKYKRQSVNLQLIAPHHEALQPGQRVTRCEFFGCHCPKKSIKKICDPWEGEVVEMQDVVAEGLH